MPTIGVFAAIFDQEGRLLCVKQNYGALYWTTPGGRMEPGESPVEALRREIHEETGCRAQIGRLIGVYAAPFKDDIVLFMEAEIIGRDDWQPDGEIAEIGFFGRNELPNHINPRVRRRILDAFEGRTGVMRVFDLE
jgi:8-oxo-dGTP diphosphatase